MKQYIVAQVKIERTINKKHIILVPVFENPSSLTESEIDAIMSDLKKINPQKYFTKLEII